MDTARIRDMRDDHLDLCKVLHLVYKASASSNKADMGCRYPFHRSRDELGASMSVHLDEQWGLPDSRSPPHREAGDTKVCIYIEFSLSTLYKL